MKFFMKTKSPYLDIKIVSLNNRKMPYNSLIRIKEKICISCGRPCVWFSRKRCMQCAKVEDFHAKEAELTQQEDGLPELIERLDELVSKWVRYSAVDKEGLVECWTCGRKYPPAAVDAGHYITRECKYLRFDLRNIKPQCRLDNRGKYGLAAEFGKRLELNAPGITEILLEESRIIHHWSREELRGLILEFNQKLKLLN